MSLALDDLEENGPDHVAGEYLQQQFLAGRVRIAVDQNAQPAQLVERFAVPGQSRIDALEVRLRRVLELHCARPQRFDRVVDVACGERDVLDALAAIQVQVFGDLAVVIRALVDRNPDLAARTAHRLALQAGLLTLDIEVAHFAEIEQALVELGPLFHPAAVPVVGQMVDTQQAGALLRAARFGGQARRLQIAVASRTLDRFEIDVIDPDVADPTGAVSGLRGVLAAPAVDEVDQAVAHALDRRDVQFHRPGTGVEAPGSELERAPIRVGRILDPQRDRADRRSVLAGGARGRRNGGAGVDGNY